MPQSVLSARCAPGAKSQCPRAPFCQPQQRVHLTRQASAYLDGLQLGDGRPKRRPLLSIIHGTVQGCLRYSQRLGGDADPACVQSLLSKTKYALNQVVTDQTVHTDMHTDTRMRPVKFHPPLEMTQDSSPWPKRLGKMQGFPLIYRY